MKQVKWLVGVLLILSMVQPTLAWGTITHVKMSSEAGNPYPGWKMEYLSGSIAPDAGYAISNEWGYKFHGNDVSKALRIANTMFNLADSNKERAFAKGWLAHLMQDRVAHGSGGGAPEDNTYGVGYSNYAGKKYGVGHLGAEYLVNGRVFYEKGWNWELVTFAVPIDLVIETMNAIYGSAPNKDTLTSAYNTFAEEYYGELAFWPSPAGQALYSYLVLTGIVADYDDYVPEVHCNPYYKSIYLTQHPYSEFTYSAQVNEQDASVSSLKVNKKYTKNEINKWMLEYAKRLEKSGAVKVIRKFDNGWLTIEFRMIDKAKANKIAEEVLKDMVKSGNIPKKTLEILKIIKAKKLQTLRSW